MKVDRITGVIPTGKEKIKGLNVNKELGMTNDGVALSSFGKLSQQIREAVSHTPDVRQDKVDQLKDLIDNDEYHVEAEIIATKILEHNPSK